MAKDPICGMNVDEKGARHYIHYEHETIYFCSDQCKKTYTRDRETKLVTRRKGMIARFLERLARDNDQTFGGTPPKCH